MWVIFAKVIFLILCAVSGSPLKNNVPGNIAPTVFSLDTKAVCPEPVSKFWSYDFHDCFIDRKYGDGGRNLNSIVDRILDHARYCVQNASKPCTPDYDGFMILMSKVISQIQDYSGLYLEDINHGRDNIKDLKCVENGLSKENYKICFKSTLKIASNSTEEFKKNVEKSVSCTNKKHDLCSDKAKISMNRIVRSILHVEQPKHEEFELVKPTPTPEPPKKKWYDYIIQPIINLWKKIKSLFGF